jgi:hypothetical protein
MVEPTRPSGTFNELALSQQPRPQPGADAVSETGFLQFGETSNTYGNSYLGIDSDDWAIWVDDIHQATPIVKEYDGDDMYLRMRDKQVYLTMAAYGWNLKFNPWVGFSVWVSSNPWLINTGPGNNSLQVAGQGTFKGWQVCSGHLICTYLKPGYLGGTMGDGDPITWFS